MSQENFTLHYKNADGSLTDVALDPSVVNIQANPTEEGTADLTKLKVGSTIYKISGGSGDYGDDDVKSYLEGNNSIAAKNSNEWYGNIINGNTFHIGKWDSSSSSYEYDYTAIQYINLDGIDEGLGVGIPSVDHSLYLIGGADRPQYIQITDEEGTEYKSNTIAYTDDITEVVANPSGTPTNELTKIQIGQISYFIGSDVTKAKIISALGYTPYDQSNPSGYISTVSYSNVVNALGYTPYNATNPNGYISEVTGDAVREALGYTPYDSTNPNGYISSISKSDVTTALGYTPYNYTNPNNYITKDVTNLTYYYTSTTIDAMIGAGLQTKIVSELPTTDIKTNVIYLVPLPEGTDGYTQWMYIESVWEKLGTTNINLTDYAKTADLSDVAKTGSYTSLLDKPTIPTDLGDLTNTAGYVKADTTALTNYTKTTDLATVTITGSYIDLSNKPTIPADMGDLSNTPGYVTGTGLTAYGVSTFTNDANYATMSDIEVLKDLDVDEIKEAIAIAKDVGTIKGVIAGSGLTGGGDSGKVTLSHSNNVTAKEDYASNETSVASGGSFTITDIKYDTNGHIAASRDRSITIPEIPDVTGMLTSSNYSDTLGTVYQPIGNYQPTGDYLTPTSVVNDNTGNYVVNVTEDTRGQITVTKGTLATVSIVDDGNPDVPTADTVNVVENLTSANHTITEGKVTVPTKAYIDGLIGDINSILDNINGEVV